LCWLATVRNIYIFKDFIIFHINNNKNNNNNNKKSSHYSKVRPLETYLKLHEIEELVEIYSEFLVILEQVAKESIAETAIVVQISVLRLQNVRQVHHLVEGNNGDQ
jgi:hypothetical protein